MLHHVVMNLRKAGLPGLLKDVRILDSHYPAPITKTDSFSHWCISTDLRNILCLRLLLSLLSLILHRCLDNRSAWFGQFASLIETMALVLMTNHLLFYCSHCLACTSPLILNKTQIIQCRLIWSVFKRSLNVLKMWTLVFLLCGPIR